LSQWRNQIHKIFIFRTQWIFLAVIILLKWPHDMWYYLHCMKNLRSMMVYSYRTQTWGQFHLVNSNSTQFHFVNSNQFHFVNSTSNLTIPFPDVSISILFTYYFLPWVGTLSTYLECLLRVVYIPSRIVIEEIFLN